VGYGLKFSYIYICEDGVKESVIMDANSNLVTWSSTYSVGIRSIDAHHKELINLVNDMYNHIVGDEKTERAYFKYVIHQIVEYVKVHFAMEEKFLLLTKCSGYAEHKKAHDSFILTVLENIRDFEDGKKVNLAAFTHFLKDWILAHIAITEKQYYDSLRRRISTRRFSRQSSFTCEKIAC
jgi:hemerythrin